MRYLFIRSLLLPRPLNSLSPRIYSIFCLADFPCSLLRPWFHTTNASSTSMIVPSFLGPPWPARPSHLHPFVRRLTKEIPPWFDPFDELAPTSSSLIQHQPFAGGRRQTSRIQRASDRLHPAIWLFGHSPLPTLAKRSELLGYLIPNVLCVVTFMVYHLMSPISAYDTSNRCLWTQRSHRVDYPSCLSIHRSSSPWTAVTSHLLVYPSLIGLLYVLD